MATYKSADPTSAQDQTNKSADDTSTLYPTTNSNHHLTIRIQELEKQLQQKQNELESIQNQCNQEMRVTEERIKSEYVSKIKSMEEQLLLETRKEEGSNQPSKRKEAESVFDDSDDVITMPNELVTKLTPDQISRYSRQLLLNDGFGVDGQQKLLTSCVLGMYCIIISFHDQGNDFMGQISPRPALTCMHNINSVIGAGGIGSTVLLYLAASGVGKIITVDFDNVEKSNLHRQVIHCERNVGMNKAISACKAIQDLNPSIECIPIQAMLTYDNALEIIAKYDCNCIVDACDNPQTRYVCNDAAILSKIPLVSGSAMGTEGQLTVYGIHNSACYRCLYPKVNPTEGCKSCSDNGVLGPVPGLIGILQATETIKVLTGIGSTMHDRLLMYDSLRCSFMNVKKPPPRKDCFICKEGGANRTMEDCKMLSRNARGPQQQAQKKEKNDTFDQPSTGLNIIESNLAPELNISCTEYAKIRKENTPHLLLDVRVKKQFEMCSLTGAVNVELGKIMNNSSEFESIVKDDSLIPIYCICRRGIASTEATRLISESLTSRPVYNVVGGYNAWFKEIDNSFPTY